MMRFAGAELVALDAAIGGDSFRIFAHLACCARAILRREAADTFRLGADVIPVGWFAWRVVPVPLSDSITAIA